MNEFIRFFLLQLIIIIGDVDDFVIKLFYCMKRQVHFSIDYTYFDNSSVKSVWLYPKNVFRSRHCSNVIDLMSYALLLLFIMDEQLINWCLLSIAVKNNFCISYSFSDFNQLFSRFIYCYKIINDKLRFI